MPEKTATASGLGAVAPVLRQLWHPAMLMRPDRMSSSPNWHGHLPLALWLVHQIRPRMIVELGVLQGDSYCAFCQAVQAANLPTKCFGVDTWAGDEHTGPYTESVYRGLKEYHDPRYAAFSSLLREYFDAALPRFADGSLDLLHIDGLHTYDAVRHDFETWRPKLSNRAVVLFHDCTEIQASFGVWRYWHELGRQYPHFTFHHSHGLGVLAAGKDVPETLRPLFAASPADIPHIRHMFENLAMRLASPAPLVGESPGTDYADAAAVERLLADFQRDKCHVLVRSYGRQRLRFAGKHLSRLEATIRRFIKGRRYIGN